MNKKPFIIALIHFIMTFFLDHLFIDFDNLHVINYIFVKILLLFILLICWTYLFKLLNHKNKKEIIKYFLIIFIPLIILFIMIYPGIWYSDDFNFLSYAKTTNFLYYLHYLSSIYYSLSLMIIPLPIGVVIIQIILYSSVITYIIYNLVKTFKIKGKIKYLMYLIFFLPLTIYYAIYANRPCFYGIFYLFYFAYIFINLYNKKILSKKKIIILTIYTSILAMWRSEGIYLLVFGPLLLLYLSKEKTIKQFIKIFIICIIAFFIISLPQNINTKYASKTYSFERFIPSYINPLGWMIKNGATTNDIKDLDNINKVIDVDKMLEYPYLYDTPCIWMNNCIKQGYTDEDITNFKKSYTNYILQNLKLFIKAKIITFRDATGIRNNTYETHEIFELDNSIINNFKENYLLTGQINKRLRTAMVSLLEGRSLHSHDPLTTYCCINNLFIPLFALIFGAIYFFIIKKYILSIYMLLPLMHTAAIAITAPANYFMYYFPVYLVGYFILLFELILIVKNWRKIL